MRRAVLLLLCACGSRGPTEHLDVSALAGERAEPGAAVISHRADGTIIDETSADAVGHASIGVEPDALVTVFFPGTISEDTSAVSVITVPVPASRAALAIHGPGHGPPPQSIGVLQITPTQPLAADHFEIDVGCALIRSQSLPAQFDIGARCGGTDASLDVLVTGYADTNEQTVAGYAAGRVPLVDGFAELDPPSWSTTGTAIPVTRETPADVTWTLFADTLPFTTALLADSGTLPDGLAVDAIRVKTEIAQSSTAQITTREYSSIPASIDIHAADFLPPLTTALVSTSANPPAVRWDPSPITADAIDVRLTWLVSTHLVIWDAVLPPDATSVAFPSLEGDLAIVAGLPSGTTPDGRLRYVDSDQISDYAALLAAGIYAMQTNEPSTIAPRPTSGQIRTTQSVGLH